MPLSMDSLNLVESDRCLPDLVGGRSGMANRGVGDRLGAVCWAGGWTDTGGVTGGTGIGADGGCCNAIGGSTGKRERDSSLTSSEGRGMA